MLEMFKQRVDDRCDSYNDKTPEQREKLIPYLEKDISEVDKEILKTRRAEEGKKYPLRMSTLIEKQMMGEQKRMSALQFVNSLSGNLRQGHYSSGETLLEETRKAINLNDLDMATALIEAIDFSFPETYKPEQINFKFRKDFAELKKSYFEKIGVADITQTIRTLEARKEEFSFLLYAIEKKDAFVFLPRQFEQYNNIIDSRLPKGSEKHRKLYSSLISTVDHVNRSMAYLTKKGVSLKL